MGCVSLNKIWFLNSFITTSRTRSLSEGRTLLTEKKTETAWKISNTCTKFKHRNTDGVKINKTRKIFALFHLKRLTDIIKISFHFISEQSWWWKCIIPITVVFLFVNRFFFYIYIMLHRLPCSYWCCLKKIERKNIFIYETLYWVRRVKTVLVQRAMTFLDSSVFS